MGPDNVLSDPEVTVGSKWGLFETGLKLTFEYVPYFGKWKKAKDAVGVIGNSSLGKKVNKGVNAFGDALEHGVTDKQGNTMYPDGSVMNKDGTVLSPPAPTPLTPW